MDANDHKIISAALDGSDPAFRTQRVTLELPVSVIETAKLEAEQMRQQGDPDACDWRTLIARKASDFRGSWTPNPPTSAHANNIVSAFEKVRAAPWGMWDEDVEDLQAYRRYAARAVRLLHLLGFHDSARRIARRAEEAIEESAASRAYDRERQAARKAPA